MTNLSRFPRIVDGTARAASRSEMTKPSTVVRTTTGGGADLGNNNVSPGLASEIRYKIANASSGSSKALLFDVNGAVAEIIGTSGFNQDMVTSVGSLSRTVINKYLANHGLVIDKIKVQVTLSEGQFANPMIVHSASLDGNIVRKSIPLDGALKNDQYNQKMQDYSINLTLQDMQAIEWTILAGETVYVTFYVKAVFNEAR